MWVWEGAFNFFIFLNFIALSFMRTEHGLEKWPTTDRHETTIMQTGYTIETKLLMFLMQLSGNPK